MAEGGRQPSQFGGNQFLGDWQRPGALPAGSGGGVPTNVGAQQPGMFGSIHNWAKENPGFLMALGGMLGGMSHNPNPALQQGGQMGLTYRGSKASGNRTSALLRRRGHDDLAALVEENPQMAKAAIAEMMRREAPKAELKTGADLGVKDPTLQNLPFNVGPDGKVTLIGGRPPAGTNVNIENQTDRYAKPPKGYRYVSDPNNPGELILETVPGGEAAEADARRDAFSDLESRRSFRTINRIRQGLDNQTVDFGEDYLGALTGGYVRDWLAQRKGTPEYTLGQDISTLRDQLAFKELRQMREMSKTGGAVGQLTDKEREALGRLNGAIEAGMREGDIRSRLGSIEQDLFIVTQGAPESVAEAYERGAISPQDFEQYQQEYRRIFGDQQQSTPAGGGWQEVAPGVRMRRTR